jgi:hypothetical protein
MASQFYPEAVSRFDKFWDSLVPPRNGQKPGELSAAASLAPFAPIAESRRDRTRKRPRSRVRGKYVFKKMLEKVLRGLEGGAAGRRGSFR